jgi:hypothetical protein
VLEQFFHDISCMTYTGFRSRHGFRTGFRSRHLFSKKKFEKKYFFNHHFKNFYNSKKTHDENKHPEHFWSA